MRRLVLAFVLLATATAADAGQKSRGNDLNNDGSPKDRRNVWELQQLYGGGGVPPSWGYESRPSRRYESPWPSRGYRADRRRHYYFGPDPRPRPRTRSYRCIEGWNGQLYCERDTWDGW